jgi:hypothetical protein
MHHERSGWGNVFVCVMLKERKRAHPNMVSVQGWCQKSSSIDLFEVGDRWSTLARPFFLAGLRFRIFSSSVSSSGKKSSEEKKSPEASRTKGPDLRPRPSDPSPLTLIEPMADVFLSKCVKNSCIVCS